MTRMHTVTRTAIAAGVALLAVRSAAAQARNAPSPATAPAPRTFDSTGVADTSIFAPLDLPAANEFRAGSGAPGARYWQQRADYDLHASLDTATKSLRGEMHLRYTNHSPDTLHFVWMQMEQNAFRENSLNDFIFPQDSRFGARGFSGGDVVDRFEQRTTAAGRAVALHTRVEGTMMKVDLATPLAPGKTTTFDVAWHFPIPEHGADRMGRDGSLFELAQWYPRMAVYDDVRGWNTEPYLGQGEFYLEYGDFAYQVTVPAGYIVAGTGTLDNAAEVLTPAINARLAKAAKSDSTVNIITEADLKSGAARPRTTGSMTWRFHAKNVRDVAWAAAPDFLWDASAWKGIIAQAYYRPSALDPWRDAADEARMSIMEYSERWFMYPYPQISAVEGPISGMEYPMVAMENHSHDKYDLYNVVTHEIGHNWFPMIVGSNERMHMWQDEGFNTFINTFAEGRRYPERGSQASRSEAYYREVEQAEQANVDEPVEINPDRINPQLLGLAAYDKPSAALQILRAEVLDSAAFDDAFRTYVKRWAFKHPTPADFYRSMENVSGRRLDWFFREFFIENPHFDQAIDTVAAAQRADSQVVAVAYSNRARGVLPIRARFTFTDGSTQEFDYPAEVWSTDTRRYIRRYLFVGKTLARIELDPDKRLIDIDRANNVYSVRSTAGALP